MVELGSVASRNGRVRNGRVRNGRSRIGRSRIGTSTQLVTYFPAEFKIARENRYIRKICMILLSAVCRPVGRKI
jgi:hypothetical protein